MSKEEEIEKLKDRIKKLEKENNRLKKIEKEYEELKTKYAATVSHLHKALKIKVDTITKRKNISS